MSETKGQRLAPCSKVFRAVAVASVQRLQNAASVPPTEVADIAILRVLRETRRLVHRGWVQRCFDVDVDGRPTRETGKDAIAWSLAGAIATAGQGSLDGERARQLLRRLTGEHNLVAWNDFPLRTKKEVIALLDRATVAAGGRPHRGGWRVAPSPSRSATKSTPNPKGATP